MERGEQMGALIGRPGAQKPDYRNRRLLGPRFKRPRNCYPTHERNELPPLHLTPYAAEETRKSTSSLRTPQRFVCIATGPNERRQLRVKPRGIHAFYASLEPHRAAEFVAA